MKERLVQAAAGLNLDVKEGVKQAPFCIDPNVLAVASDGVVLIFGQCTKEPDKWHAFFASKQTPKDHPLDYLQPSVTTQENGVRVATFNPTEITDQTLVETVKKVAEVDALAFMFGV